MGYLYKPKYPPEGQTYKGAKAAGTLRESGVWWAKYYVNGRMVRESTGTEKEMEAKRFLKEREGRVATWQPLLPRVDRIRYEEVAEDLRRHYQTTGCRDLAEAEGRLRPLARFFAGRAVARLTAADMMAYAAARQTDDVANGTINRELAMLTRMLRLAYKHGKLLRVPVVEKLKEAPPRAGFFERHQYEAVRRHLHPDLQVAVDLAYTIRLDVGGTKNDDGREVYLTPALKGALAEQLERVAALGRTLGRIIPFVFPHVTDGPINPKTGQRRYVAGDRRRDFRKAWLTAGRRAGVPGMLRHDFRRTAVRNLVNDGTPEKVAMQITGHKTRSVFDRYHIVSPADLKAATARIAARDGHSDGQSGRREAMILSRNP